MVLFFLVLLNFVVEDSIHELKYRLLYHSKVSNLRFDVISLEILAKSPWSDHCFKHQ